MISEYLSNEDLISRFRSNGFLPEEYGNRLDERVVEFPWVLSRLDFSESVLLDAGSALNFPCLTTHRALIQKQIVIYTLSPEEVIRDARISYVYGDLRRTLFRDECFDEIVSISTLEHIGMDNTLLYSGDSRFNEKRPEDYLLAVQEFRRLLKPGGRLFITVPYGVYENHGWLQQFDRAMVERVRRVFDGSRAEVTYYRYNEDGWNVSTAEACADCRYFDIHRKSGYDPDYAAAARAVACLELVK
jgi:SAM-dependent methyltransferase